MGSVYNGHKKQIYHIRQKHSSQSTESLRWATIIQSAQLLINVNPQRYWACICCSDLMIFEGCDNWLDHQGAIRDIANRVRATDEGGRGGISRIKLDSSWRKDWNIFLHRSAFDRTVCLSEFHINVLMEIEDDATESMEVLQLKLGQPTRVTDVLGIDHDQRASRW